MIPPTPTAAWAAFEAGTGGSTSRSRTHYVPVLIVGGGIAGCALAYNLARRGMTPTLVERGRLASLGASAVAAALLNPYRGRSGKPGPYDLEGLSAFWRLTADLERLGLEPGAHRSGVLRMASSERQARAWKELPGLRRCRELPQHYRAPNGAFLVEEGGWVEPGRLVPALAQAAAAHDATLFEGCPVEGVTWRDGWWLVRCEDREFTAEKVVLCPGAGEVAGVRLPRLERVAGDQVTLRAEIELPYPVAGPVYLVSDGSRVFVGGNHREPGTEDPDAPRLLRTSAARMVPTLATAPVERVWTGVRARRPDNVPMLEELEPNLWYLGAFGGRGFLTAPLLAERLAALLGGNRS